MTTHRGLRALAVMAMPIALAASACSADDALTDAGGTAQTTLGSAVSADDGSVTVTAHGGDVTVPVTDTGIWALDYGTALNLLAIGVVPTHFEKYSYELDPFGEAAYALLEDAGVELVEADNMELVAAAAPSLIIGVPGGNEELLPQLEQIAPVILLPGQITMEAQTELLATVTGHQAEAAAVQGRLDVATDELRDKIAGSEFDGASVSVLSACGEDTFCTYGSARGFGPVLAELGFERIASQSRGGNPYGYEQISTEQLDAQVADIIIALTGSVTFGAPSPFENPLLDTSSSTIGEVDFAGWYELGALNNLWVLHDLDAILFGDGEIADTAAGLAMWTELTGENG